MPSNVEVKAKAEDLAAVRARALALGARVEAQLHQVDTFFVVADGRLKLRQLGDDEGELIAYRRPDLPGPKRSDYRLYSTTAPAALARVLRDALPVLGVVEKRRELLLLGQTRIHLDRVEGLGSFLELEVVLRSDQSAEAGDAIARELLEQLAVPASALIAGAYLDLLSAQPDR